MRQLLNNSKVNLVLLLAICLLGMFLRVYKVTYSPPGFHIDEADISYQAYSVIKTGHDYFGNLLSAHPQSFVDRRPFLYMYLATISISLFGLSELAARLPSMIFGILTIPLLYWLAKNLFHSKIAGLASSLILAILPWHIHYSRMGYELTLLILLLVAGCGFVLKWSKTSKLHQLVLGLFFLILSMYTYSTAKLFIPMLLLCLGLHLSKQLKSYSAKQLLVMIVVILITISPLAIDNIKGVGSERFKILSVFTDTNAQADYLHYRWLSSYAQPYFPFGTIHPSTLSKLIFDQNIHLLYKIASSYLSFFSPQYLIFNGDPNQRHSLPSSGLAGFSITILAVFGLYRLLCAKQSGPKWLIFSLLLLAPIPSAITRDGMMHATRGFLLVLPLSLLAGFGLFSLPSLPKKAITLSLVLTFTLLFAEAFRDWHIRLGVYPISGYSSFNYGWRELATKVNHYAPTFDKVIIDNSEGAPIQTLYAFYTPTDPKIFQVKVKKQKVIEPNLNLELASYSDNNVYFGSFNLNTIHLDPNLKVLLIVGADRFRAEDYQQFKVIDAVNSPLHTPLFVFLTNS